MSGESLSRRYDVVAETRRRWSQTEKRAIVREASAPCTNVSAVARRHGIKPSLLFRWKRDFAAVGAKPAFAAVAVTAPTPVAIAAAPEARVKERSPAQDRSVGDIGDRIEIELANGRRIRVGAGSDMAMLARIIDMLEDR